MSLAALDASLSCYSPQIVSGGRHFGIRRMVECGKWIDFKLKEWIKKVILIEPDETTITLLRNRLPWD